MWATAALLQARRGDQPRRFAFPTTKGQTTQNLPPRKALVNAQGRGLRVIRTMQVWGMVRSSLRQRRNAWPAEAAHLASPCRGSWTVDAAKQTDMGRNLFGTGGIIGATER